MCGVVWGFLRTRLVSHLRRSEFLLRRVPGLPGWAKLCRAYGAGLEWRKSHAAWVGKQCGMREVGLATRACGACVAPTALGVFFVAASPRPSGLG